jgi:phosphatidate cytidylyltransferase
MTVNLKKRIITSIFLVNLLLLMYLYSYILIISLIITALISWIEFYALISKIIIKNRFKDKLLRFTFKSFSLFYLSFLVFIILFIEVEKPDLRIYIYYSLLVSILSDVGGLSVGKLFKGRKLTKISPNKTISGSMGSFIFSILLVPIFINNFSNQGVLSLLIITLVISLTSQVGDIIVSLLKRKAKVKDTSDLLPGHGGVLDRIDGIIFAIPIGFILLNSF